MIAPIRFGAFLWVQDAHWGDLRDAAIHADRAGFDSLWISDHLIAPSGNPDTEIHEAWTTLAALAASTKRLRLGLLVGNNLIRHPGLVAKMAVTVDHISEGRLDLGLGSGWYEPEIAMHGFAFEASPGARIDRLDESIAIIRALTSGTSIDHRGRHYTLHGAVHAPRAIQNPVPILIGGSGRRRTLELVARWADAWHADGDVVTLQQLREVLFEHCVAVGRDPAAIERVAHRWVRMHDDARRAEAVLTRDLEHHGITHPPPWLPLTGTPADVAAGLRPITDLGYRHILLALAAPFDHETIERLPELREEVARFA